MTCSNEASKSAVLLDGEKSNTFKVQQGVAQGCSLSPILFSVFINNLLKEVEEAGLGVQLCNNKLPFNAPHAQHTPTY